MRFFTATTSVIAASCLAVASGEKGPTFVPHSSILNKQLALRGGAGPLDPIALSKATTVLALATGWLGSQAPRKNAEMWTGSEECTKLEEIATEDSLSATLGLGVCGFCLFFLKTDPKIAIGSMLVVVIHTMLRALALKHNEVTGTDTLKSQGIWLPVNLFMAHACFTGADYADTALKVHAGLSALACLPLALNPETALKSYNPSGSVGKLAVSSYRALGLSYVGISMMMVGLVTGMESTKAMGLTNMTSMLRILALFVKDHEQNVSKGPLYSLLAYFAVSAVTCLL